MKNVFDNRDTEEFISRINKLAPNSKPLWGKLSVAQMLARCNVTYEFIYDNKHSKPGALKRFLLQTAISGSSALSGASFYKS